MSLKPLEPISADRQRVIMKKLQYISAEHRQHLLNSYDMHGIAMRIDRYLSITRKKNMDVHEHQCRNMWKYLRRGYFQDEANLFGKSTIIIIIITVLHPY